MRTLVPNVGLIIGMGGQIPLIGLPSMLRGGARPLASQGVMAQGPSHAASAYMIEAQLSRLDLPLMGARGEAGSAHESLLPQRAPCSIALVEARIRFLKEQPRERIGDRTSGTLYDIDYRGLPPGVEFVMTREESNFYHYTGFAEGAAMLTSQRMVGGEKPYIRAVNAGTERIYSNYLDLTGLFFVDHVVAAGLEGFLGAHGHGKVLKVTIPAGMPMLKLSSRKPQIPFYLIPLEVGAAMALRIEEINAEEAVDLEAKEE